MALMAELAALPPTDPRAAWLRSILAIVTVLSPPAETEQIRFGAHVRLEGADGEIRRYRIVGPDESDARTGLISVDSPVARALLGKEAGDEVVLDRPNGKVRFTITAVSSGPG